jgi:hypothetical protein
MYVRVTVLCNILDAIQAIREILFYKYIPYKHNHHRAFNTITNIDR